MVNAVADIDIETPWLTKRGLGAGGAAAAAVVGKVAPGGNAETVTGELLRFTGT